MHAHTDTVQKVKDASENIGSELPYGTEKDKTCAAYVLGKATRIAAVTLRVFENREGIADPIRSQLEETAIGLVRAAVRVRTESLACVMGALELAAVLECVARAGRVGEHTVNTLLGEIESLASFVRAVPWGERTLDPSLFALHTPDLTREHPSASSRSQRQETDIVAYREGAKQPHSDRGLTDTKKDTTVEYKGRIDRAVAAQKDRRASILGILQRKDKISVRDVVDVIKDCSEKTLQRELLALVAQGVLVKEGERRWSVYRLA